ncbi:hypothetical protein JCM16161A_09840 [Vulcanisaeta sp. JCM 16161]|uniref:EVE domain-containing protein n=1 Tax=Vulcanisaeta sp. JCM 16161 TaxID=1295372 RepID=UPI000A6CEE5D|nr:EVE domain-containing protein [Vulcanisaeta sp. JCM 16161]
MMNEENYRYAIENGIYGLPEQSSRLRKLIKPGDKFIVYIIKRDCKELCESFVATLEITSDWRRSNKPLWPDEVREGKIFYPWVVNVKVIVSGKVEFNEIKDELSKILGMKIENPGKLRLNSMYYCIIQENHC